jgi:hypothetical protein
VNTGIGGTGGQGIVNAWRSASDIVYGSGGGGQGRGTQGIGGTNAGTGSGTNAAGNPGIDAVDETGAGGGGGYRQGGGRAGDGGSGIVIVRYSPAVAPLLLSAPTISGIKRTGETLEAARGSWTGSPTSYSYQWKRANTAIGTYSNIGSAISQTYVLTDDDIDKYIKVSVTATNVFGTSLAELSAATSVVVDLADSVVPTVSTPVATATGFTFTILNYSNLFTYATTTTSGSVTRTGDEVVVIGLSSGASATVTISVTRASYKPGSKTILGSAITAPTSTTVAPALSIVIQAPKTTVAQGQASVATIAPRTISPPSSKTVVSTTLPVVTTTVAPPVVEKVAAGETSVQVDGVKTEATVTRENNQMVVTAGSLSATLSGVDDTGNTSPLDSDGNIHLAGGDVIKISVGGFKTGSLVEVWLFSTPTKLGSAVVGADGAINGLFTIPAGIKSGSHRVVISAKLPNGKPTTFTLGILVGDISTTSTLTRVLIAIPIALAIGFGFLLPTQLRRRRKGLSA